LFALTSLGEARGRRGVFSKAHVDSPERVASVARRGCHLNLGSPLRGSAGDEGLRARTTTPPPNLHRSEPCRSRTRALGMLPAQSSAPPDLRDRLRRPRFSVAHERYLAPPRRFHWIATGRASDAACAATSKPLRLSLRSRGSIGWKASSARAPRVAPSRQGPRSKRKN
jgi:hypothetical protein